MIHERISSKDVESNPVEASRAPVAKSLLLKQDLPEAVRPQDDRSGCWRRNCSARYQNEALSTAMVAPQDGLEGC